MLVISFGSYSYQYSCGHMVEKSQFALGDTVDDKNKLEFDSRVIWPLRSCIHCFKILSTL